MSCGSMMRAGPQRTISRARAALAALQSLARASSLHEQSIG